MHNALCCNAWRV